MGHVATIHGICCEGSMGHVARAPWDMLRDMLRGLHGTCCDDQWDMLRGLHVTCCKTPWDMLRGLHGTC